MTIPVVRKRAKRPKTRTGCRTCRQRHIKCDEGRPACRKCISSNRECAGYDYVRPECKSQAVLLPKGSQVRSVKLPTMYPVHRGPSSITLDEMTPIESYAFDFFRLQTVRQLPGSSWTLSWERLALQMGHHEPAVTHAAIALGSIHRALTFEAYKGPAGIDPEQHQFALSQYNKAMGYIRNYIETLDESCSDSEVEVVLLVSLLFFCFEVLHSEDARATMHLRTGLRILYDRIRGSHPPATQYDDGETKRTVIMKVRPRSNMDVILQTFVRLDGDLTIVGDDEPYLFPVCTEKMPTSFYNLDEAMVHLDAIASKTHDFCRDIVCLADGEVVAKRSDFELLDEDMRNCLACAASRTIPLDGEPLILKRMDEIKTDLAAWMAALAGLSPATQRESQHLLTQIHFFYIWFVVSTWRDSTEMAVDRFDVQFHHILSLAEQYVDLHYDVTTAPHTRSTAEHQANFTRQAFTLGTDLVPCIAMIAFKARTSSIRRRCVELLRKINLQGVFDSYFLASFVQLIWEMEEKRARDLTGHAFGQDFQCSDVPEEARFVEIELSPMQFKQDFYKADVGRLVYATIGDEGQLVASEEMFNVSRPPPQEHTHGHHHVCKGEEYEGARLWALEEARRSETLSRNSMTTITTITTGSSSPSEVLDLGEKERDLVMEGCVDDLAATSWGYPAVEDAAMREGPAVQG